jgi:hypothetical protein
MKIKINSIKKVNKNRIIELKKSNIKNRELTYCKNMVKNKKSKKF